VAALYKLAWLPSQKGLFLECLQAHQATVLAAGRSIFMGANSVPLCDPSQNGWEADRPQEHHQYEPGSAFCTMGLFWKTNGSLMAFLVARTDTRRKQKVVHPAETSSDLTSCRPDGWHDCSTPIRPIPGEAAGHESLMATPTAPKD
jgi:hypothetical protein